MIPSNQRPMYLLRRSRRRYLSSSRIRIGVATSVRGRRAKMLSSIFKEFRSNGNFQDVGQDLLKMLCGAVSGDLALLTVQTGIVAERRPDA